MNQFQFTRIPPNTSLLERAKQLRGRQVTENVNEKFKQTSTFGDRLSDQLSAFAGSWTFIIIFAVIIVGWAIVNSLILIQDAFDPYPYVFLNLILSTLAALQAPVIMMSQNRQADKDRLDSDLDYAVNLKAEAEISILHHKLDALREDQWQTLVAMQEAQIKLLEEIVQQGAARPAANASQTP